MKNKKVEEDLWIIDDFHSTLTAKLKFKTYNVIIKYKDFTQGGKFPGNAKGYILEVYRTSNGWNWSRGFSWLTKKEITALEKVGVEMSKLKTDKNKGKKLFNYAPKSFYNLISETKGLEKLSGFVASCGRLNIEKKKEKK